MSGIEWERPPGGEPEKPSLLHVNILQAVEWMIAAAKDNAAAKSAGYTDKEIELVSRGVTKSLGTIIGVLARDAGVSTEEYAKQIDVDPELAKSIIPPDIMIDMVLAGAQLR